MAFCIEASLFAFTLTARPALERLFDGVLRRPSIGKESRNIFLILRACDRFSQSQIVTQNSLEGIVFIGRP